MVKRNIKLGGQEDFLNESPNYQDINDTNDAIVNGISEIIEDSALVANDTTTYTLPTRRNWTKVKVLIYATGTAGSDNIDTFRVNGNNGASDYKYSQNIISSIVITNFTTDEIYGNHSSNFLQVQDSGDECTAEIEFNLVNDRIHFKGKVVNVDDVATWGQVQGFMDTSETKISSISFRTVTATISGRIKIIGMESN